MNVLPKFMHNQALSSPKIWDTSVIFKLLPKVNNYPLGENSPNLVTLFAFPAYGAYCH
jgi:hypothetical protein